MKKNPEDDGHVAILRAIKLTSAIAALVLFFMPWIDIQCSGKSLATQTGIQTITGMATPSEEMKPKRDRSEQGDQLGTATLAAIAIFALGMAIICLLVSLLNNKTRPDVLGSALCGVALLCLLLQLGQGFPVKEELIGQISSDQASNEADSGGSLAMFMVSNIEIKVLPALMMTCVLMGIPVLLHVSVLLLKSELARRGERIALVSRN